MFSRYPYAIDSITWPTSHPHLPDNAEVGLPAYLVDANEIDDAEWTDYIFEALTAKFGLRPIKFGSFQPAARSWR